MIIKENKIGIEQSKEIISIISEMDKFHNENEIYQYIVEQSVKLTHSEGGTLFLADPKTASLIPVASLGISLSELKSLPYKFGLGVCGWVAQNTKPLLINDVQHDTRFSKLYDKKTGYRTTSILCTTLPVYKGKLFVLELINHVDNQFEPSHLILANVLGKYMILSLDSPGHRQRSAKLENLNAHIINSLPVGFVSFDRNGKVTACNDRAFEILMLGEADVVGRDIESVFDKQQVFRDILIKLMKDKTTAIRAEVDYPRLSGKVYLEYSTFFIQPDYENLLGYGIIFQNVTNFKINLA